MDSSVTKPTIDQLRALSHPVRVRLLSLLRVDGPATASALAQSLRINTGAASYHLRTLARNGFIVEDTELGNARDRWWKAAQQHTLTRSADMKSPEARDAQDAYLQAVAVTYSQQLQAAVEERPLLPQRWREATATSDWQVRLTPERAKALIERVDEVLSEVGDEDDPAAADYSIQLQAFPMPGRVEP